MGAGGCLEDWQESPGKTEDETAENNRQQISDPWKGRRKFRSTLTY